jgi:hypothetical protein
MNVPQPGRRPGDLIIDRYMSKATDEEREAAQESLYAYVAVLLRIASRRASEDAESEIRTTGVSAVKSRLA